MKLLIGMIFLIASTGAFAACGLTTASECKSENECKAVSGLTWDSGACKVVAASEKSTEGCGPITGGNPSAKVVPTGNEGDKTTGATGTTK